MQTLERHAVPGAPEELVVPERPRRRPVATNLATVLARSAAAMMLGAGAIHFALMGEHAGVSWSHGLFFATVAWLQVVLAMLLVFKPTRAVLLGGIALNLAVLGVWIVSRTLGIAIGGDGTPEAWGWTDGLCAAFEVGAIAASALLLSRRFARRPLSASVGSAVVAVIGLTVIALTAWVFSPTFANASGTGAGAVSADGHHHGAAAATGAGALAAGHTHAPVDDKGLSALSNGHHHAFGPEQPLAAADRVLLSHQIDATIAVSRKYPTVAAAEAGGYHRAGPFSPGLGAHYISYGSAGALNPDGVMDDDDLAHPLSIIYDGTSPDSRVAGFMYYSMSPKAPQGFAGPNDLWHFHENICLKYSAGQVDAPYGMDKSATKAQCSAVGGQIMKQTQWMVHVWSVPGWESGQGLFGEVNPALSCPDGSYFERPANQWAQHLLNICRSAP